MATDESYGVLLGPGDREANNASWQRFRDVVRTMAKEAFASGKNIEITAHVQRQTRSLAQNRLYWLWMREIRDYVNEAKGSAFSDADVHDWMREQFLDSHVVEIYATPVRARKSTTTLTVKGMAEYLEKVEWFAVEKLGCPLSRPPDYQIAMESDNQGGQDNEHEG